MPDPLHTRLRFCPSGPVHIGHVALGLTGLHAAEATAGTFCLRSTHLKATRGVHRWESYRKNVERNLDDLEAVGVVASEPAAFKRHGMSPRWRVQRQDETALTEDFWAMLGFEALWGKWPAGTSPDPANDWHSMILGAYEQGWCHPFIRLAQVVGDVCTGRNCIFRGEDHLHDGAITNAFAQAVAIRHFHLSEPDRVARYVPNQYFFPKLRQSNGLVLSSGDSANTTGFYVQDFLKSKLPPERLYRFLERVLFRTEAEAGAWYSGWSSRVVKPAPIPPGNPVQPQQPNQEGVAAIIASIKRAPTVDDGQWARFLKTGEVPEWET